MQETEINTYVERMHKEARRNFLYDYVQKADRFFAAYANQNSQGPSFDSFLAAAGFKDFHSLDHTQAIEKAEFYLTGIISLLEEFVSRWEEALRLRDELKVAVLSKVGDDTAGIRTTLSSHFSQLNLQPERGPYVDLTEKGLSFHWDTPHAQNKFLTLLQNCGINVRGEESKPNVDSKSESYKNAIHSVVVSHQQLEKLLQLSQYHPYNLRYAADDLYKAKNLNRAKCLIESAQAAMGEPLNAVTVGKTNRMDVNDKYDLVNVTLDVLPLNPSENKQPHHVVILLDDSSSMDRWNKMNAANTALKQFVLELPDETLVSLRPFNAPTVFRKISAGDIKKMPEIEQQKVFTIPASGDTPLIERLAESASFLREPGSLLITEAALNHTTVVMLTDGQANGTAADAIHAMQTSSESQLSYGVNGFSCRQLPPFLSIAFGRDSDRKFIEDLSQQLSSPHAYISDGAEYAAKYAEYVENVKKLEAQIAGGNVEAAEKLQAYLSDHADHAEYAEHAEKVKKLEAQIKGANAEEARNLQVQIEEANTKMMSKMMELQIKEAFDLLMALTGRIPVVFVGLTYYNPDTEQNEVVATETRNLFFGRTRNVAFRLPKNAQNVQVCVMMDEAQGFYDVSSITMPAQNDVIKNYIDEEFLTIRKDYSAKFYEYQSMLMGEKPVFGGRLQNVTTISDDKSGDWQMYYALEKKDIEQKIAQQTFSKNTVCIVANGYMEYLACFVKDGKLQSIETSFPGYFGELPVGIIALEKYEDAPGGYKLQRVLQGAVKYLEVDVPNQVIAKENLNTLTKTTIQEVSLLKELCKDQTQISEASPLIGVCSEPTQIQEMDLFLDAIQNAEVMEGRVDFTKSTLSRAAAAKHTQTRWLGTPVPVERLQAIEDKIFTAIDQMDIDPKPVLQMLRDNPDLLMQRQQANVYRATPLIYAIVLFGQEAKYPAKKEALKKLIMTILQEQEFPVSICAQDTQGQTALHRAVWYGQFEIAKALIERAIQNNELERLKTLRNKVLVGATEGETFVENIRKTKTLTQQEKEILLNKIAEPVNSSTLFAHIEKVDIEKIKAEIAENPKNLNLHGPKELGSPTPLFSMLYQLVRGQFSPETKSQLRECILELLEQYQEQINFFESNTKDGNTLLHYALYHGELDIAGKIIEIAKKCGNLAQLLKARNVVAGADGKGETPVLNLVKQYEEYYQLFSNTNFAINSMIIGNIVTGFSELPQSAQNTWQQEANQGAKFMRIYNSITSSLTTLQLAEIGHLTTVHQKALEGYSGYYWLKAAPVHAIEGLISDCKNLYLQLNIYSEQPEQKLVEQLYNQLLALRENGEKYVDILKLVRGNLYIPETKINHIKVRDLLKRTEAVLEQYEMFANVKPPEFQVSEPKNAPEPNSSFRNSYNKHGLYRDNRTPPSNEGMPAQSNSNRVALCENGLRVQFNSPEEAKSVYNKIPANCKRFIILDCNGANITIHNSKGPGTNGVYRISESKGHGVNFPNTESRNTCCESLGLVESQPGNGLLMGKGPGRITAMYITPAYFKKQEQEVQEVQEVRRVSQKM